MPNGTVSLNDVFLYLSDNKTNGYVLTEFRADWSALSDEDKAWFKAAVADPTHV